MQSDSTAAFRLYTDDRCLKRFFGGHLPIFKKLCSSLVDEEGVVVSSQRHLYEDSSLRCSRLVMQSYALCTSSVICSVNQQRQTSFSLVRNTGGHWLCGCSNLRLLIVTMSYNYGEVTECITLVTCAEWFMILIII